MNDVTKIFLHLCKRGGYKRIAIGMLDLEMEVCRDWGALSEFSHDVFAAPDLKDAEGSPLLWGDPGGTVSDVGLWQRATASVLWTVDSGCV